MSDSFQTRTLKRKNVKGLALSATPAPAPASTSDAGTGLNGGGNGVGGAGPSIADTLEIGLEFKLDLRSEDLIVIKELGAGNGGTVSKVMHATTKVVMARKVSRIVILKSPISELTIVRTYGWMLKRTCGSRLCESYKSVVAATLPT